MLCGIVHLMALASVLGRPVYSVYPNGGSAIREFLHGKILPRVLDQGAQDTVYIMWSRDEAPDSAPARSLQPNHFIPIFRVLPMTDSNSRMPGAGQGVIGSKSLPVKKRQTKGIITNFFPKVDAPPGKTLKRPNDEMNSEGRTEDSKGAKTKKLSKSEDKSEAAVKPDTAKVAPRNLQCVTVERWKHQDLEQYETESWLTYDSEKTKRGHYCTALKYKVCS